MRPDRGMPPRHSMPITARDKCRMPSKWNNDRPPIIHQYSRRKKEDKHVQDEKLHEREES